MGYLRRTQNYPERISLFDLTDLMSIVVHVVISVKISHVDKGDTLEK